MYFDVECTGIDYCFSGLIIGKYVSDVKLNYLNMSIHVMEKILRCHDRQKDTFEMNKKMI